MIRSPFLALGLLASSGLKQRGPDEASAGESKRSSHLEFGSFSGLAPRGRNLPERRFGPVSESTRRAAGNAPAKNSYPTSYPCKENGCRPPLQRSQFLISSR